MEEHLGFPTTNRRLRNYICSARNGDWKSCSRLLCGLLLPPFPYQFINIHDTLCLYRNMYSGKYQEEDENLFHLANCNVKIVISVNSQLSTDQRNSTPLVDHFIVLCYHFDHPNISTGSLFLTPKSSVPSCMQLARLKN